MKPTQTFSYRLDRGERFSIECKYTRRVCASGLPTPWTAPFLVPWRLSARFIADCEVTDVLDDGYTTIDCRIRDLEVQGRTGALRYGFELPVRGLSPVRRILSRPWRGAVGTTFTVKKNLAGHVAWASGGERLVPLMSGTGVKSALNWFGALLAPRGERWEEDDRMPLGGAFFGLPMPANEALAVHYAYRPAGEDSFQGRRWPSLAVDMSFDGEMRLPGGLRVAGHGRGDGSNLIDTERGKIARSLRRAKLTLDIQEPRTGLPLGALTSEVTSDAYHV